MVVVLTAPESDEEEGEGSKANGDVMIVVDMVVVLLSELLFCVGELVGATLKDELEASRTVGVVLDMSAAEDPVEEVVNISAAVEDEEDGTLDESATAATLLVDDVSAVADETAAT